MTIPPSVCSTKFERDGFELLPSAIDVSQVTVLLEAIAEIQGQSGKAGMRNLLSRSARIHSFAFSNSNLRIARSFIGGDAKPVRAIYFDKTPTANWYVTWHQDLTIPVSEKIDTPGWGPWSVKDGVTHVQPPNEILNNMISLRFHLDKCAIDNGAIKFIAGSHLGGALSAAEIAARRDSSAHIVCAAELGDVVAMRPLILHSSSASSSPDHRRVLHIEYAAGDLPSGLRWAEA
ncbi:phytanoyl-CoA dioxygenase family protein [bacterium]|nr:phytanoyl-CoA dioxygenase family protein [bacterium]